MTAARTLSTSLAVHILLLLALCGVLYIPYLGNTPLFDKGEPREALAVQDIVQRGEWLFPLKRASAIPSKPPMFHWSAALAYQFTGELSEATIRFPSAFYATLGVLLTYLFGRKIFGAEVALLAAAILATTTVYFNQALSARVDMTMAFFVTAGLLLFYSLYCGWLTHPLWYFALYGLVGLGTLAKGPLGLLLPALVIAVFLAVKKRWDLIWKFAFHPGVLLTLVLVLGWYGLAILRGGEGFVDRQLLSENLNRFFGGSGHSHPVYYYISYLFSLALPWALFLPFLLWDLLKRSPGDGRLYLKLWFAVMFVFFSLSAGKRPVYLLPLYPALALLLADWCYRQTAIVGIKKFLFRAVSVFALFTAAVLVLIVLGDSIDHDPGRFFAPLESLLKPKDRANWLVIKSQIAAFDWRFDAVVWLCAGSWLAFGYFLWRCRIVAAARVLLMVALLMGCVSRGWMEPEIAKSKSYREFMAEVNRLVQPNDKLVIFGTFNSDPLVFYRGRTIAVEDRPAVKLVRGDLYVITSEDLWQASAQADLRSVPPLLRSSGKGPEGDARLLLLRAEFS
jgi:4-amino-4-deoxy-L-arabinose transferase-like glycosyltransferase